MVTELLKNPSTGEWIAPRGQDSVSWAQRQQFFYVGNADGYGAVRRSKPLTDNTGSSSTPTDGSPLLDYSTANKIYIEIQQNEYAVKEAAKCVAELSKIDRDRLTEEEASDLAAAKSFKAKLPIECFAAHIDPADLSPNWLRSVGCPDDLLPDGDSVRRKEVTALVGELRKYDLPIPDDVVEKYLEDNESEEKKKSKAKTKKKKAAAKKKAFKTEA